MQLQRSAEFHPQATVFSRAVIWLAVLVAPSAIPAQRAHPHRSPSARHNAASAPVVLLSDLHFEPFRDPARLRELRSAPIDGWPAILAAPASPTQATDFAALQKSCPVRGVDTSFALLSSSLHQAAAEQPHPLFVTVSGDLLAHAFDCRFKALAPGSTEADLSAFAAKTVAFVTAQLSAAFPSSPIYLALGNNDTGCTDYHEDPGSSFLQQAGVAFAAAARTGDAAEAILREFSAEGDYNIALPAPMENTRLLVLQNIFDTVHFATCAGRPGTDPAAAQLAWLGTQLAAARAHHQHAWIMAHVPPGVDMYATLSQHRDVCTGQAPATFLASQKIVDILTAYPDVVSLALFAHTHADELRVFHAGAVAGSAAIPIKLVSSVSPVNGNRPTFTVAQVAPGTAQLLDYTVFLLGDTAARKEYSFRETYKLPSFSAASLQSLTAGFLADTSGEAPASQAYQTLFFPGDTGLHAAAMRLFWRSYACSLREASAAGFRVCTCPAQPEPPTQ